MPDLDELRAFLAVVGAASVKGAAEQLGISRSSLRRRLESLEQRMGTPLLWADASGTHLTPAARVLAREGEALLDSYRALIERARATHGTSGTAQAG